jgi:hypothetical protein
MSIRLPQPRIAEAPKSNKRQIPLEAILQVMGRNPYAEALNDVGPALSQALQKRAELRRNANISGVMYKEAGETPPADLGGFTPDTTAALLGIQTNRKKAASEAEFQKREEARKNADLNLKVLQAQNGYTTLDPNGQTRNYPGISGVSLNIDESGLPTLDTKGFKPGSKPVPLGGSGGSGGISDDKIKKSLLEKFNADPSVRKAQQSLDSANTIRTLVDSNNPIAANAIPTFMARASGEVGNLSEADKAPFGGSQAILSRFQNALEQKATGRLTPENATFIKELVNKMEGAATGNIETLAKLRSKQYSGLNSSLKEDDLYNMLRPGTRLKSIPAPGGNVSPAAQALIDKHR